MKRFIEGESRNQSTMLPEYLDDYIAEDNPVRAVEAFIDELDLRALGFVGTEPAATGRPSYHPSILMKLYLYGYLNRIQSSRRLERECERNIELMWLIGKLSPDFKTVADFRRDNGEAIRSVCRQFVMLCRRLSLFSQAIVAIDGSKFKAVNAHDRNFTHGKLEKRMQQIDQCIERYLTAMDTADRQQSDVTEMKTARLREKIATLKKDMAELRQIEVQLKESSSGQVSLTDPDARAMATSNSRGLVGYNVQTAVETKYHLIVAHEVTNIGTDRQHLSRMAKQAKAAMETDELNVLADRGYYSGDEVLACDEAGIVPYVSKPMTSGARAEGRFDKEDFVYDPDTDQYNCPGGSRLVRRCTSVDKGHLIYRYWSSDCPRCPIKEKCTPGKERRVSRWEHETTLESMQRRLDMRPEAMRIRRQTVEHPFGTIKYWMGARHFLTRTLDRVSTEMSLHVLAYNMKRVMQIMGVTGMIAAMSLS